MGRGKAEKNQHRDRELPDLKEAKAGSTMLTDDQISKLKDVVVNMEINKENEEQGAPLLKEALEDGNFSQVLEE